MTHLGAKLSALADGQLSAAATERALAHVACCVLCASELAAAREAHRALAAAGDVLPTASLNERLLALARTSETAGCAGDLLGAAGTARRAFGESALTADARRLHGSVTRRLVRRHVLTGGVLASGVFVVALLVLGTQPSVVPATAPTEALDVLGRSARSATAGSLGSGVPGSDLTARLVKAASAPGAGSSPGSERASDHGAGSGDPVDAAVLSWMRDNGWICPESIPEGFSVSAVRLVPDAAGARPRLEVDVDGPDGRVVLVERSGRLDARALEGYPTFEVDGRLVHVLQDAPWRAVWQEGGTVVEVVAERGERSAQDFVARFPHTDYDDGIPARLGRGWATMTGALTQ